MLLVKEVGDQYSLKFGNLVFFCYKKVAKNIIASFSKFKNIQCWVTDVRTLVSFIERINAIICIHVTYECIGRKNITWFISFYYPQKYIFPAFLYVPSCNKKDIPWGEKKFINKSVNNFLLLFLLAKYYMSLET